MDLSHSVVTDVSTLVRYQVYDNPKQVWSIPAPDVCLTSSLSLLGYEQFFLY